LSKWKPVLRGFLRGLSQFCCCSKHPLTKWLMSQGVRTARVPRWVVRHFGEQDESSKRSG